MLCAISITSEGGGTIELVYGIIKGTMGLPQLRRHGINIVQVGKRCVRRMRAGIK